MKYINLILIFVFCGCTSNKGTKHVIESTNKIVCEQSIKKDSTKNNVKILSLVVDTLTLSNAYNALMKHPDDKKCQENFFKEFPTTWFEYISTYGYPEGQIISENDIAYGRGHIEAFGNLDLINDTLYCTKLIDLSIGAYIDADAPNYLHWQLHNNMGKKTALMMKLISSMLESDQMLFWGFYWASLHKSKTLQTECDNLISSQQNIYPNEVKIMRTAFELFCGKSTFSSFSNTHVGLRLAEGCCCQDE